LVYLVFLVYLVQPNKPNEPNKPKNLLLFGLLAPGPPAHHNQYDDGHAQEPKAGTPIGRIGELDEISQSPD
jgi:hypothetical protein